MQTLAAQPGLFFAETQRVALRFFWKEVRMLRGLAAGVVGLTLVVMLITHVLLPYGAFWGWMLIAAFGAAALFAVAATVTLFAVEREVGTTVLLELLPQNRAALFAGKVLAATGMTVGVLGVLAAVTYGTGLWPEETYARAIAAQGAVAIVEALCYGLLMSLICPQPLLAAVLAMAAASLNSQLAMMLSVENAHGFTLQDFQEAVPTRLAIAALVGVLDVWLGLRWLQSLSAPRRSRAVLADEAQADDRIGWRRRRLGMFGRLVWQSVRQSWKTILAATVIGLLLMFATEIVSRTTLHLSVPAYDMHLPISLLFLPALFGALAFRADQRQLQYRFLAEHAGRPRMIWLARQLTGLTPTLAWCLAVNIAVWTGGCYWFLDRLRMLRLGNHVFGSVGDGEWTSAVQLTVEFGFKTWLYMTLVFWMASLVAYAFGQFLSLAFRSEVFAGLLSLGGSIMIALWAYVAIAWQLPPVWFIFPLGIGLMLASWLRVPDWLEDRSRWSRWVGPAVAVAVPATVLLCYVPVQRAAQVRDIYPYSISAWSRPVERSQEVGRKIADEYANLADKIHESGFVPNDEVDEQVTQLSRKECQLPERQRKVRLVLKYALSRAEQLRSQDPAAALDMLLAAHRIQAQRLSGGDLSSAWWGHGALNDVDLAGPLLDWATAPGQSPELIKRALDELGQIDRNWPTPTGAVMNEYLKAMSVIRGETPPRFLRIDPKAGGLTNWLTYLANGLPGETSRAEKSLDILAACALDYFVGLQRAASQVESPAWERRRFRERLVPWYGDNSVFPIVTDGIGRSDVVQKRANLARAARTSYLAAEEFVDFNYLPPAACQWVASFARRRAERVRLALIAYHLEHGRYPDTLEQLTPEHLAKWEINDPYAGVPFCYRPEGFDLWMFSAEYFRQEKWYPPHTPLLWSIGSAEAEPRERIMKFTLSDAGERQNLQEQPQENDEPSPPKKTHSGPSLVFEPGVRRDGGGHFLLPLPAP